MGDKANTDVLLYNLVTILSSCVFDNTNYERYLDALHSDQYRNISERQYTKISKKQLYNITPCISKDELLYLSFELSRSGVSISLFSECIRLIIEKNILSRTDFEMENVFYINTKLIQYFGSTTAVYAYVCGFEGVLSYVSDSVFLVEHIPLDNQKEDISNGSGYFFAFRDLSQHVHRLVITNRHVCKDATINIYTKDNVQLPHSEIIFDDDESTPDLAAVILSGNLDFLNAPSLNLFDDELKVLDEILVLGFPSVAGTRKNSLLVHRGEICGFATIEQRSFQTILYSAKTHPGNSGGPLINKYGRVIGIVEEDLLEKRLLAEDVTGVNSHYYAAIPASVIRKFLNEYVIPKLV